MEFRNLTPFSVLNYKMLNVDDIEHHVIAMKVGYKLIPTGNNNEYTPHVLTDLKLEFQDQFVNQPNSSSVRLESDLAPFKPRCDVIINGMAYAPDDIPTDSIVASILMTNRDNRVLIEKSLRCFGERQFVFNEDSNTWQLPPPKPIRQLPIDYRYAFGGECKIYQDEKLAEPIPDEALFPEALRSEHPEKDLAPIAHSTYEYNPLGLGFITPWYQQSKNITSLPAPQIESLAHPITAEWMTSQLNNKRPSEPAVGFGAVGRAWLPRRLLAGTYDDMWLDQRHPYLPHDFDFSYWNCAPTDQQIDYPATDFSLTLKNLTPTGELKTTLPGHRPFVLLRMQNGLFIPLHLNLDTLLIDTEKLQLSLTYRLMFEADLPIRVCEARFEMDPNAPLVRFAEPQEELNHG
ncbi:DUF2169 domain-containing protein [Providencia manganoxydans]|uniref:DUF2169 family type VI secretion system accessory protein n=1 Tax=Providencia manganoxydans TaxID=2923283 RepID=UPI0034E46A85